MAKKAAKKASGVVYSVHPCVAYVQAVIDNMPEKTGRSLDEWIALVEKGGPSDQKENASPGSKASIGSGPQRPG